MAQMNVEVVAVERRVWSGWANMLLARTTEGELGILPGHEPLLGELVDGVVTVRVSDGEDVSAAVHGGFLSVTSEKVSVLAESAELADEIDVGRARQALQDADAGDAGDEQVAASRARALSQLRAVGQEA